MSFASTLPPRPCFSIVWASEATPETSQTIACAPALRFAAAWVVCDDESAPLTALMSLTMVETVDWQPESASATARIALVRMILR